jgi:hypothetical protein
MIEKAVAYPVYQAQNKNLIEQKVMLSLTYAQILEIACVFFYVNSVLAKLPKWLGGIKLDEEKRALHKAIHNAAVNCALSLEENDRLKQSGGLDDL